MTIPGKKTTTLTLGGEDRAFVLDLAALATAENVLGGPIPLHRLGETLQSFSGLRAILYGGLRRKDPGLTLDAFDDMLDMSEVVHMGDQIAEAVRSALPQEDEVPKAGEAAAAPASSRSSTSTSRARKTSGSRPRSGVS